MTQNCELSSSRQTTATLDSFLHGLLCWMLGAGYTGVVVLVVMCVGIEGGWIR